jgi:glycosyltransferase involved in cell wall biosynthesis
MNSEASVILSFYNKIEVLKLVLSGFERQSLKNFEIIIADDGSDNSVVHELQQIMQGSSLHISHVWHPDQGWQKNTILNKAIVAANSDYIIFTDGDCIPHRHFVKEHFMAKETNYALTGRRVLLSRRVSEFLTVSRVRHGFLEKILVPWMILERLSGEGQFVENALYFKWKWIRKKINKKDRGLLGSNFSIHKADLLAINGFDERYQSPYVGEDTDLEFRLRLNGCKFRHLKHLAIQYHYFHPRLEFNDSNYGILNDNKQRTTGYTPFGIIKS